MLKLIKTAAIGCGIYLVAKAGEKIGYALGYYKGSVATVRAAGHDPEWAAETAKRFDELDEYWKALKNKKA